MSFLPCLLAALPLLASSPQAPAPEKIPVLVVGGANNHWWEWTTPSLAEILGESGKFDVTVTNEPAKTLAEPETYLKYAALVLDYNGPRWGEAAEKLFVEASVPVPASSSTTPRTTRSRGGRSTRR